MINHYYEVQLECYNTKGEVYFSENYRYTKRYSALQKLSALKRRHPSCHAILVKKNRSCYQVVSSDQDKSINETELIDPISMGSTASSEPGGRY